VISSLNVIRIIKSTRIRRVEHVARMGEKTYYIGGHTLPHCKGKPELSGTCKHTVLDDVQRRCI
jgi:hypothetical protein